MRLAGMLPLGRPLDAACRAAVKTPCSLLFLRKKGNGQEKRLPVLFDHLDSGYRPRDDGQAFGKRTFNVQAQGRCAALSRSVPWSAVLGLGGTSAAIPVVSGTSCLVPHSQ